MDRTPQYVESVIHELRQIVIRVVCPVHDCGPSLTVDFAPTEHGGLDVTQQNCCPRLDEMVARAMWVYPLFHVRSSDSLSRDARGRLPQGQPD